MIKIDDSSFVDPNAVIIGNVTIGKNCGIYPNAVIRGDENTIEIGDGSNVQDCCVIHVNEEFHVKIGKNVSIGHCAMIHGAIIEDNCLIGINSTILNGAKIGSGSVIGANALVTAGMVVPKNSLVLGVPGKVIKEDKSLIDMIKENAYKYQELTQRHKQKSYDIYKHD